LGFSDDWQNDEILFVCISFGFYILYIASFQFSFGPFVWIYLAEIMPAKGLGIAIPINWISSLICIIPTIFSMQAHPKSDSQLYVQQTFCLIFASFTLFVRNWK
jgi:hypothetical protein